MATPSARSLPASTPAMLEAVLPTTSNSSSVSSVSSSSSLSAHHGPALAAHLQQPPSCQPTGTAANVNVNVNATANSNTIKTSRQAPPMDSTASSSASTAAASPVLQPPHQQQTPQQQPASAVLPPVIELPEYFHLCSSEHLISLIADMLGRLVSHNDQIPLAASNLTRFHSRAPPAISISDYLRRIVKYAAVERICLLTLLIYIDRVCERHPLFTISSLTVHRFVITAITCACKAICDVYLANSMYGRVGGITTKELNILEVEFLFLIDWDLRTEVDDLQNYYVNLVRQHPRFSRMVYRAPPVDAASHVMQRHPSTQYRSSGSLHASEEASRPASHTNDAALMRCEDTHPSFFQQQQQQQQQQPHLASSPSRTSPYPQHMSISPHVQKIAAPPSASASAPTLPGFHQLQQQILQQQRQPQYEQHGHALSHSHGYHPYAVPGRAGMSSSLPSGFAAHAMVTPGSRRSLSPSRSHGHNVD
ncbi:cyclin-domain-containing protein [Entophlyctis helioformis]|nr:cyclin-domain-containing protein [Entophlyctis helioformis]